MRAVGFRRREDSFDFARRFRFAYSLEHYNKFTGKLPTRWVNELAGTGPIRWLANLIIAQ